MKESRILISLNYYYAVKQTLYLFIAEHAKRNTMYMAVS